MVYGVDILVLCVLAGDAIVHSFDGEWVATCLVRYVIGMYVFLSRFSAWLRHLRSVMPRVVSDMQNLPIPVLPCSSDGSTGEQAPYPECDSAPLTARKN
eukprot:6179109-Pleurochrysis_carterae.AAC.1